MPPPEPQICHRCGSRKFIDVPIHGGRSSRRDCAKCDAFICFVRWCGQLLIDNRPIPAPEPKPQGEHDARPNHTPHQATA